MVRDVVVILPDEPGQLYRVGHALGHAGINIEGLAALTGEGTSVLHLLLGDWERALLALAAAGIEARATHDAIVLNLSDRPDAMADAIRPLSNAGINVRLAYIAVGSRTETRLVLITEQHELARDILGVSGPDVTG